MACFTAPVTEAIVVRVVERRAAKKENGQGNGTSGEELRIPLHQKLHWLSNMLWGGSALLAFEHVWHGEVTPWFPFLTAMGDPADAAEMFHEIATVGVGMAVAITAAWGVLCKVADAIAKRPVAEEPQENLA